MKQSELWFADLNPTKGSEQAGIRPVLIISGNLLNTHLPIVLCCPLTTKIKNYQGNLILKPSTANGLKADSEVLTFHVRSIAKDRLTRKIGKIKTEELEQVHQCLNDLLRY